jgi:hypothetical protein
LRFMDSWTRLNEMSSTERRAQAAGAMSSNSPRSQTIGQSGAWLGRGVEMKKFLTMAAIIILLALIVCLTVVMLFVWRPV